MRGSISSSRPCHRPLQAAAGILIIGFLARPAAAQADVVNVVLGGSVRNDSNLFRHRTAVSDTITTGYVGLRIDKPYAQQRFQVDATQTAVRYNNLDRLNFSAIDYKAAWLWQLGPRSSGTLSAQRTESLVPSEDTTGGTQRNVRISTNRAFYLDGWVSGSWHLLAGVSQSHQASEQTVQIQPDFDSNSVEVGIKYLAPSGNSISAIRRSTQGDYRNLAVTPANPVNNDYLQGDSELNVSWRFSGSSAVTGRLAWQERDNRDITRRDFAGSSADLGYNWTPAGKLSFNLSARRTANPLEDPSFSHTTSDTLALAPAWQIAAKTALRLSVDRTNFRYRGTGAVPPVGPPRKDSTDNAQLSVTWLPMRSLSLGASLQRQRRSSNTPGFEFNATIASVNAALTF